MTLFRRTALALVLLAVPAVVVADSEKTREVKLPMSRILGLANALAALDGYEDVVKDGAAEKVVRRAYKFEPGLRTSISRNITTLRPLLEGYNKEQSDLLVSITGGTLPAPNTPETARFNIESNRVLAVEWKLNLFILRETELKMEVNPIPGTILSNLDPIMEYK